MADFIVTIDTSAVDAVLSNAASGIETGFGQQIKEIGRLSGRSIELNFRRGGRPDPFAPLKPTTIRHREYLLRTGRIKALPASLETPLRVTDTMRKAATATSEGEANSNIESDSWSFSHEIELSYAARQDSMRPFFFYQDSDVESFADLVYGDVRNRINRATR